jgi:16S rRNA (guanine(1405)-N(7))-methyltransferase
MSHRDDLLARLVETVRASPKYRRVSEALIRRIGARELEKRRSLKEALAATRSELHQIGGAYLDRGARYPEWLAELRAAAQSTECVAPGVASAALGACPLPDALGRACASIMRHHSSTRERLPILEAFYTTTLAGIAPVRTVLDVACGFNPLAIPWMPLAPDAEYYACDIYEDLIAFVNGYLALSGVRGHAEVVDVAHSVPSRPVDLALILKTLPCLEQTDRSASLRLLETIHAEHILVSFPVRSLGGRQKGMAGTYEARFRELIAGKNWPVQRFEFATELAFLVHKA